MLVWKDYLKLTTAAIILPKTILVKTFWPAVPSDHQGRLIKRQLLQAGFERSRLNRNSLTRCS